MPKYLKRRLKVLKIIIRKKHLVLRLATVLVATMVLSMPVQAHAATVTTVHFTGVLAPAGWGFPASLPFPAPGPGPGPGPGPLPPPPLVVLLIPIRGHVSSKQPVPFSSGTFVTLIIMMNDPTTGVPTFLFSGDSTDANFQVSGNLDAASLTATFQGFDVISNSPKTISIVANWAGMGSPTHMSSSTKLSQTGFSIINHFSGRAENATATASLSGDVTMPLGASTSAAIMRAVVGTILKLP